MKTDTNVEQAEQKGKSGRARWIRTAMLTYTLAGPVIRAWINRRVRQGSQAVVEAAQALPEVAQSRQADLRERLEELTRESRQTAVEQAQNLRDQARQFQKQARQLRKALRKEAKQRRKLLAQMRDSGVEWGQDMLKRSERLTEELVERSEEVTEDLAKRGRKLVKRGRKLVNRSAREQNRVAWMFAGFGVGLVIAGAITYWLVRNRALKETLEEEEAIELPQSDEWTVTTHPAGEIVHVDQNGTTVTKLETVTVENTEQPENAAFVGVISTQSYYPVDTELEPTDLIYFLTEEEAQAQGFKAAE
jgi:ribosome recycling factor